MGVLSRAFVSTQFKLGIYQARQITRIERGGLVISCADSRYQPDGGIRRELSPDEWLLFSWRFFPRDYRKEFYDEEFLLRERYYDYFVKTGNSRTNIYSIYKNQHDTGYIIVEYFGENRGRLYSGMHINQWGTSDYKTVFESGLVKPIEYVRSPVEAATCMLADLDDFKKVKIDLASLHKDCEESPGSCALHLKLTKLLQDCKHTDLYLEKQVAP
ncbi:MAG: hypothetical protein K8H75_10175 [Sulfuricella sp.]|nr:hypothetical protein [Sulfuricella sp.]